MSLPLEMRLLGLADRVIRALGLFEGPLRAEELARLAQRRTGLSDFGHSSFEEPLEVLLQDYERSADLGLVGRQAARWDVVRFLTNLLRLREEEKRHPEILDQAIDRPIFIAGMPRSGSSFLHNLIAQDPGVFVPFCWQTIHPCPLPGERPGEVSRRVGLVDRQIGKFARMAPEFPAIHPFTARSAQECSEITAHVFRSRRFETTHQLAEYPRWLEAAGDLPGYAFHKRFLQHLQYRRGPGRWILKCPEHTFSLPSIRAVYPDAGFVFMHRDPVKVLQSVAKMTEVVRRPFTRHIDRLLIGRQVRDDWSRAAAIMVEAAAGSQTEPSAILNIGYRQLTADPMATVRTFYEHFALPLGEEAASGFRRFVADRHSGAYGKVHYRPEEFGLDSRTEAGRFRDYIECFAIESEGSAGESGGEGRRSLVGMPVTSASGAF
jgi:hypothetical protein